MGKRGPKSANVLKKTPNQPRSAYLSPVGRNLGSAERAEWDRRVKAKDPGFYCEDDAGLLIQLCQAVVDRDQLRRLKIEAEKAGQGKTLLAIQASWRDQAKLIASLSRQLKIGASARETHRATAKASRIGAPESGDLRRAGLMFDPNKEPAGDLN
jgi:hypothetical protein